MTLTTERAKILLGVYNRDSGMFIKFGMAHYYALEQWAAYCEHQPWGEKEMSAVVTHLRAQVKAGKRNPGCLRFSTLIEPSHFDEELSLLRMNQGRPKPPTERQKVIAMTTTLSDNKPKPDPLQSAAAALERTKLAAQLREWRKQQGMI